jgi:hypothetical protein
MQRHSQRHGAYNMPTVCNNTILAPLSLLTIAGVPPLTAPCLLHCSAHNFQHHSTPASLPIPVTICCDLRPFHQPQTQPGLVIWEFRNFELQSLNAVGLSQSFQDQQLTFQTKDESHTRTRNYEVRQLYGCNSE